ncbi:MAG: deoxyhypusine synthase [Gammaproteobacteria bacterium]|jgi:deoxyhypusine synthase
MAIAMRTACISKDIRKWAYVYQINDSTTICGADSRAVQNEAIACGKLDADTPSCVIESVATIVAPLVFAQVLGV